jgi:two-component system cell cycle sensor histidine kinase/response regulator CckA
VTSKTAEVGARIPAVGIDLSAIDSLLGCFSRFTKLSVFRVDPTGKMVSSYGRQELCTDFYLPHPRIGLAYMHSPALDGDGDVPGQPCERLCENGLRSIVFPLATEAGSLGTVHAGFFLYHGDSIDESLLASQCEEFGFDSAAYSAALRAVPRFGCEQTQDLIDHLGEMLGTVFALGRELEASEARRRDLYESSPVPYQSLGIDGVLLDVNDAWTGMLGYDREEVVGRKLGDFLAGDDGGVDLEALIRSAQDGDLPAEFEMKHKNGDVVSVKAEGRPDLQGEGCSGPIEWALCNLTKKRRVEELVAKATFAADRATDYMFWLNPAGQIVYVNRAACKSLGYSQEELLSMGVWDLAVGVDPEDVAEMWGSIKGQGRLLIEAEHRTKSGKMLPVEVSASHFEYEGDEYILAFVSDITKRKEAEEEAKGLRAFFELTLARIKEGIWITDAYDRMIYCNRGMESLLGMSVTDALGLDVRHDLSPEFTRGFIPEYSAARRLASPKAYEARVVNVAGEDTVQSGWLIPRYEEGRYAGMICTVQDVTPRRQAEDALRESEERYRTLFELESDAIILLDNQTGRVLEANEAAVALYGYSHEEWLEITQADVSAQPDTSREDALAGVTDIPLRWHRKKDGAVFPVEITATHLDWKGRSVQIAAVRDITRRVEVETELRRRDEQLRQSQKMEAVGQLAGGIAHDFNNLLTAILGYSDIVLAEPILEGSQAREDIQEMKRAAERAAVLTRQILAYSRRQTLRPTIVSMNEIVSGMEPLLRRTLGEDVTFVIRSHPELAKTKVDVHQLEQVVLNLAVNARDAMPGGGTLTMETANVFLDEHYCRAHPDAKVGDHVVLVVSDTGIGMDPDLIPRIFEPFFTTKGPSEGTGLGLSTVYGIVKQSGGSIDIHSELGCGTRILVYLPAAAEQEVEASARALTAEVRGGDETILVVDDEESLRSLMARVLRGLGYQVLVAADAEEALELVEERGEQIDLLLTDVVLPGSLQGNDLARCITQALPRLPVLYMSGFTHDAIVRSGRLDEGVDLLEKPFTADALARTIREALDDSPVGSRG